MIVLAGLSERAKLKRNRPLTDSDLSALEEMLFSTDTTESRQRFAEVFGRKSLKRLIREIVGCDRAVAKQAFFRYLQGTPFSANQIRFVETIIDYLTQNGVMDLGLLYEPPFTDTHTAELDGVFNNDEAKTIINIVHSFNASVDTKFPSSEAVV